MQSVQGWMQQSEKAASSQEQKGRAAPYMPILDIQTNSDGELLLLLTSSHSEKPRLESVHAVYSANPHLLDEFCNSSVLDPSKAPLVALLKEQVARESAPVPPPLPFDPDQLAQKFLPLRKRCETCYKVDEKCTGGCPCNRCVKLGVPCEFRPPKKRGTSQSTSPAQPPSPPPPPAKRPSAPPPKPTGIKTIYRGQKLCPSKPMRQWLARAVLPTLVRDELGTVEASQAARMRASLAAEFPSYAPQLAQVPDDRLLRYAQRELGREGPQNCETLLRAGDGRFAVGAVLDPPCRGALRVLGSDEAALGLGRRAWLCREDALEGTLVAQPWKQLVSVGGGLVAGRHRDSLLWLRPGQGVVASMPAPATVQDMCASPFREGELALALKDGARLVRREGGASFELGLTSPQRVAYGWHPDMLLGASKRAAEVADGRSGQTMALRGSEGTDWRALALLRRPWMVLLVGHDGDAALVDARHGRLALAVAPLQAEELVVSEGDRVALLGARGLHVWEAGGALEGEVCVHFARVKNPQAGGVLLGVDCWQERFMVAELVQGDRVGFEWV